MQGGVGDVLQGHSEYNLALLDMEIALADSLYTAIKVAVDSILVIGEGACHPLTLCNVFLTVNSTQVTCQ